MLRKETNSEINNEESIENVTPMRTGSLPNLTRVGNANICNGGYHTRSRRPVEELPNVQLIILEQKKKTD